MTAVELDVADALADGPLAIEELARQTQTKPDHLFRVFRALESIGVFAQFAPRVFANTEASALLRKDAPGRS